MNGKCFKCGRNQYSSRKPFCTDDFCNKDFYQKPKQETLEKAAEKFYPPKTTDLICSPKLVRDAFIAGAKWQAERMYSEVFEWLSSKDYLSDKVDIIKKEFEQFKNKQL